MSVIKLERVPDISHEAWLELRRRGLGGSDAATVVGLNPYSSKLALYADKLGLMPEKADNEAMRQGRDLEDYVASRWEEATGKKCRRENHILYNDRYPWAFANIDRVVVGEKAILECKTTSVYNNSDFARGDVPPQYYVQVTHYLAVTGYERAYLAVLVLNKGFYTFVIERNEAEIAALMEAEKAFWNDHVVKQNPPEPDGSESALAVLNNKTMFDDLELMPDAESLFDERERVSAMIKELEEEKDELTQKIIARMGDKARGQAQGWTCSYLPQARTTIDGAKLMLHYAQAYADCATTKTSRTFRAKKMKEGK